MKNLILLFVASLAYSQIPLGSRSNGGGGPASISLTKSVSPASYGASGDNVIATYTITNTGGVTLSGPFSISDSKFRTISSCGSGSIVPGAIVMCAANYSVTPGDVTAGSITSNATASTTHSGSTVNSNSASATTNYVSGSTISVKTPGHRLKAATCNGTTDDTAAIQAIMNYASAHSIPTVMLPASTCLLNTANATGSGAYYNLNLPSNVLLQGVVGSSTLLQGSRGRVTGALVANPVMTVGAFWYATTWNRTTNYPIQQTAIGDTYITFITHSDAGNFNVRDFIAIWDYPSNMGDVVPSEATQVTRVDATLGRVYLMDTMKHVFSASGKTPQASNVTSRTAHNNGINGVIIEGASAITIQEQFYLTVQNSQFINDTNISGVLSINEWNRLVHDTITNNTFSLIGPRANSGWNQDFPQRTSGYTTFTNNTWTGLSGMGWAEMPTNLTFTNNHVYLGCVPTVCGFAFEGRNSLVSGNDFHMTGNLNIPGGHSAMISDMENFANNAWEGGNKFLNNTVQCIADGNQCLQLGAPSIGSGPGTIATGNTITVSSGSAVGIEVYNYAGAAQINNNHVNTVTGNGITFNVFSPGAFQINGNTVIASTGGNVGIDIFNTSCSGGCSVQNNTSSSGFSKALSYKSGLNRAVANNH